MVHVFTCVVLGDDRVSEREQSNISFACTEQMLEDMPWHCCFLSRLLLEAKEKHRPLCHRRNSLCRGSLPIDLLLFDVPLE